MLFNKLLLVFWEAGLDDVPVVRSVQAVGAKRKEKSSKKPDGMERKWEKDSHGQIVFGSNYTENAKRFT